MTRFLFISLLLLATSCIRSSGETWENFKTAGRYMQKGVNSLWGKDYESRMLTFNEEFVGPYDDEFIPLKDSDLSYSDKPMPQPKVIPGKNGTPFLSEFYSPSETLASLFTPVHFKTDDHVVKQQEEIEALSRISSYLKKHSNISLIIEGNCDERASASYNMALGMRRANYVRSFLVKQGIDLNRIYTVSRGKENPIALGHSPEDWKTNRRCEFKIYEKN